MTFERIANVLNQPDIRMLKAEDQHQANEPLELVINSGEPKLADERHPTAQDLVV